MVRMVANTLSVFLACMLYASIASCAPVLDDAEEGNLTHQVFYFSEELALESKFACMDEGLEISFSLKNTSAEEVVISSASRPWDASTLANQWKVLSDGRALQRSFFGTGHAPGPIFLAAGESIMGTLKLATLYPDLPEALRQSDVEIVHSYWWHLPKRSKEGDIQELIRLPRGWCQQRQP